MGSTREMRAYEAAAHGAAEALWICCSSPIENMLRWNTKVSGFHQIRPIVKLADGTWLVGDRTDGTVRDYLYTEFSFADVRWMKLDIARVVTTGTVLDKVDLSKVDEIGFVDLMPSSGHGQGGWSDVAQIEVFSGSSPRTAAGSTQQ